MSEWKKVKLGEVANIFSGYAFKSQDMNSTGGIPLIKIKNIADFIVSTNCDSFLNKNVDVTKWEKYKLQADDFLIAMTGQGSVGRVGKMMSFSPSYYVNQRVAIVRPDATIINPYFLYKCFATKERENELFNKANGAGQPNISPSQIGEIEFSIPTISSQNNIAITLSRYDSLIENYQKQIKLLEEAAQRLYKEWFVDLHFPGHENTKIVDGVPEGWEKKKVGDITPIKTGKKDANFGTVDGSYPFFTCAQEPIKAPSYSFDTSAVILAGNGDFNVKLYRGKFEAYQRTYVLEPTNEKMLYLLYFCISENMNRLATGASGSTIKFLTKGMIESLVINEPSINVLNSFNQIVEPIRSQKEKLQTQIRLLTEARDRLLPKLMSGEIDV